MLTQNCEHTNIFRVLKFVKKKIFFGFIACSIIFFAIFALTIELTKKKT